MKTKNLRLLFWVVACGVMWVILSLQVNRITEVTIHRSRMTGEIVRITDRHGKVVEISHRSALLDFPSKEVWDEP